MSLREVRSPLTPKMTIAAGAMTRSTSDERRGFSACWAWVQASTGCDQTSDGTGSVRSVESRTVAGAPSSVVVSVVVGGVSVIARLGPHRTRCIGDCFPFQGYRFRCRVGDGLQGDWFRGLLLTMPERVENALAVAALVGVRAEVVALGLDEVGRQRWLAQGIEVIECRRRSRHWNAPGAGSDDGAPRAANGLVRLVSNLRVKQQVDQLGVVAVSPHDVGKKRGADDAASGPDTGDLGQVEIPVVSSASGA